MVVSLSQAEKKSLVSGNVNGNGHLNDDVTVSRRPSKRQQEKAPEGRLPHVSDDPDATPTADVSEQDAGPAPAESRFSENL